MLDPGNLYTRKLEEEYVSAPLAIPAGKLPAQLKWEGEEQHGTKLKFQIRSAPDRESLAKAKWIGPSGEDSFFLTSGSDLKIPGGKDRWVQYKALFGSPDGGDWPVLSEVEIVLQESR